MLTIGQEIGCFVYGVRLINGKITDKGTYTSSYYSALKEYAAKNNRAEPKNEYIETFRIGGSYAFFGLQVVL